MVTKKWKKALRYVVLVAVGLFFFVPFAWLISTSLKSDSQIFSYPPQWIPSPVRWQNYVDAFQAVPYLQYLLNSLTVTALAVVGNLLSVPPVAYAFSKLHWPGRDKVFLLVLATMMLPFQITMIPLYSIYVKLNWVNTYLPLVLPDFFGKAYFVFMMRQFFNNVPNELLEAGRIDGASEFRIYWQLVLPLARSALVTVTLFAFVWSWTDFLGPLIYLTDPDKWTISLGLSQFTTSYGFQWAQLMAASAIFIIPMVIFFFFMQKSFLEGISTSGIK